MTIGMKDGTTTVLHITAEGLCSVCDFRKDAKFTSTHAFWKPWPYTPETFAFVEFSLPNSFFSPEDKRLLAEEQAKKDEDKRLAAEAQAKKDAVEAVRRKRQATEQKRVQASDDALAAIKAAEERRTLRANCTVIYQNTIDKKVKDLTVREEQQVRTCQGTGLYSPR
jgi:hypothetical protein